VLDRSLNMDKQKLLFENLKDIKDYWVKTSIDGLNLNSDLIWSEFEEQYKMLQSRITTNDEKYAYGEILNEIIKGVIHFILVMIDGEDKLSDEYTIDLIEQESKKSLRENIALHEEFLGYLLDVEE
jgi:hypothetical protein